ncbi:MAG: hypothetical protein AAB316_19050, partial [Bacteroidota bacterium]
MPTSTVQAPQSPSRQPIFVPVRWRWFRIKSRTVVPGGRGVWTGRWLRMKEITAGFDIDFGFEALFWIWNFNRLLRQFPGNLSVDIAFNQSMGKVFRQRVMFAFQVEA